MYHKSILGSLNQSLKANPPKTKKIKRDTTDELSKKPTETIAPVQKSNYSQLISQLGLTKKSEEIKHTLDTNQDFRNWVDELQAGQVIIKEINFENTVDTFYEIDIEEFKRENLEEIPEEELPEICEVDKMGNDLIQNDKFLSKQMLNDVSFGGLRYKGSVKTTQLRTNQFVFDYLSRNESGLKRTNAKREEEQNEIGMLLDQHLDLSILDFELSNYEEFSSTVVAYLLKYVSYFNQKSVCEEVESETWPKLSGFVKTRILIIVAFKKEAYDILNKFVELSKTKIKKEVSEKWEEEFASQETAFEDKFVLGIFVKEGKVHLTSNLNFAEILVTTTSWIINNMESDSLLSSVEVFYAHKINELSIQNQDGLLATLEKVNKMPEHKFITEDLRKVRKVFMNGLGRFFRQNISYGEFASIQINSLTNRFFLNRLGHIRWRQFFPKYFNEQNFPKVKFSLKKVEISSLKNEFSEKFNYFKSQIWEKERESEELGQGLIIVNDYLQYQELKSYFQNKNSPVGFASEHTPKNKIQGVYAKFNTGVYKYILTTERALYYQVAAPKKYKHAIFFGFPYFFGTFEKVYEELVGNEESEIVILFSKKDAYEIEKLAGSSRTRDFFAGKNRFKVLEF